MSGTISIGELRQNPTQMLRDVRAGATYTITDHGEPVAEVTGALPRRWIPIDELDALLRELGADDAWADELSANRRAGPTTDPWEHTP